MSLPKLTESISVKKNIIAKSLNLNVFEYFFIKPEQSSD